LPPSAGAQTGKIGPDAEPAVVVAVVAAVMLVTVVFIHESPQKRTITGCVNLGENGMSVTDEKDKRTYKLSGNVTGLKPDDQFASHGKKVKRLGVNKLLFWEVSKETTDFVTCEPQTCSR
jgi:hypothetical protein